MTRFQREISHSTRARQLYPEAFCQPKQTVWEWAMNGVVARG